jgi:hypothetical protein
MSEFPNFEGSIPEVSKTFIHRFSILKITFFVITFFSKVLLTEYELFGQKLFKQVSQASTSQVEESRDKCESRFGGLFYNFYHNEIDWQIFDND